MPISFPELPSEVRDFLSKQLSLMAPLYIDRPKEQPLGGRFNPEDMRLPLQVIATDITSLSKDQPTWNLVEHGWLVFVGDTQPCRTAETGSVVSSGATRLVFLGFSSGPQADDLLTQIKGLESLCKMVVHDNYCSGNARCRFFKHCVEGTKWYRS